jgi:hypothetical protein
MLGDTGSGKMGEGVGEAEIRKTLVAGAIASRVGCPGGEQSPPPVGLGPERVVGLDFGLDPNSTTQTSFPFPFSLQPEAFFFNFP